jgi:hypothetical protein
MKKKVIEMKKILLFACMALVVETAAAQTKPLPTVDVGGGRIQVMNLDAKGRLGWGGYSQIGDAVRGAGDGAANTRAIIAAVGTNPSYDNKPYAASQCAALKAGGFDDWYLPSLNELKAIQAVFKTIGLGEKNTYWSSTEANGTQAAAVYMYDGTVYNNAKVNDNNYVCVRKAAG